MIEALITNCAIDEAPPAIIREIIRKESGDDPIAVNINGVNTGATKIAETKEQAAAIVDLYVEEGTSVDIGYMQVNTIHQKEFGVTALELFDPCLNITIGSTIFMRAYNATRSFYGDTDLAVKTALSAYNTGTFHKGFENGYVERYEKPAETDALPAEPSLAQEAAQSSSRVDIDFGGNNDQTVFPRKKDED